MIERIVIVDSVDPVCFYGVNNSNMTLIRNLFPKLRIAARGSVITATGDEGEPAAFQRKVTELEAYAVKTNTQHDKTSSNFFLVHMSASLFVFKKALSAIPVGIAAHFIAAAPTGRPFVDD